MKNFSKLFVALSAITILATISCKKEEKKDDNLTLALLLASTQQGPTCTVTTSGIALTYKITTATTTSTEVKGTGTGLAAVYATVTVGQKLVLAGTSAAALEIGIYTTTDCPFTVSSSNTATLSTHYTASTTGFTRTITFLRAGTYNVLTYGTNSSFGTVTAYIQ